MSKKTKWGSELILALYIFGLLIASFSLIFNYVTWQQQSNSSPSSPNNRALFRDKGFVELPSPVITTTSSLLLPPDELLLHQQEEIQEISLKKNLETSKKKKTIANIFFFHPMKRLVCAKNLTLKYNIIPMGTYKDGPSLFSYFNKQKYPYRHLFALLDAPALELAKNYDEMGPSLTTVPPYEITKMCTDKFAFNAFLRENGFEQHAPKVYPNVENVTFPVIIKPLNGTGSESVYAAGNTATLNWVLKKVMKNRKYVLQEAIQNRIQRIVHVSAVDGRMLRMVCYERDLEDPIGIYPNKWRTTPPAVPNHLCHEELFAKILKKLSFTGIGDFDVKLQKGKPSIPKILEFNPRIPGTIRRDENLLADFICSIQWNGTGIITSRGCEKPDEDD